MVIVWILAAVIAVSAAVTVLGVVGVIRDGRRISAPVYAVVGAGATVLAVGLLLTTQDHPQMLIATALVAVVVLVLGNLVGYPLLTIFLLWSGLTVLRRESRTLGNALALLAGIGMLLLPATLGFLAPSDVPQDNLGYMVRYGFHLAVVLVVGYFGFVLAAFVAASLVYRWRPSRVVPQAVIVLGAGLINGKVGPLLAGRLDRGLEVQRKFNGTPLIITSGGQGADEPRPEGTAMREYLLEKGVDPASVLAERESRNTEENLRFSVQLLEDPASPITVVTSSYHAFRAGLLTRSMGLRAHAVGSKTAWYFLPSALLREFVAVLRDRAKLHLICLGLLLTFSVLATIVLVPGMVPPPDGS